MIFLRSVIFTVCYYLHALICLIVYLPLLPFLTKLQVNKIVSDNCKTLMIFLKRIVGLDIKIKGLENIPSGPCIICSKHQSGLETATLQTFLPPHVYILKKQLLYVPILGQVFYFTNQIPIDRKSKDSRQKINHYAKIRAEEGFWICIFPEGTRTKPGDHDTVYKLGTAHLAQNLKMDILPISLNTGEFYSKRLLRYPGCATFSIGTPIAWDAAETPKELMQLVKNAIETEQRKIEGVGPLYKKKH